MAGYVFSLPELVQQLGRIGDVARVTLSVLGRLPGFCRRYRRAYLAARAGQALPDDAPAMRPFAYLALVVVLTVLLVPLARLLLGLPPTTDILDTAQDIVGADMSVVHLGRLTGIDPLDGLIGEIVRFASYALLAGLFRVIGGGSFELPWIAGFFAYVVGAFEALLLIGLLAATVAGASDGAAGTGLATLFGALALVATLAYAVIGPSLAWPGALQVTRGRVVRVTLLAVLAWAALHVLLRTVLVGQGIFLLGFGL